LSKDCSKSDYYSSSADAPLQLDNPNNVASEGRTRWVALVTLSVHGLRVAADDPALATVRLHREAFDHVATTAAAQGDDDEEAELAHGDGEPSVVPKEVEAGAVDGGGGDGEGGENDEWEPLENWDEVVALLGQLDGGAESSV
jgi:hypothetical protein